MKVSGLYASRLWIVVTLLRDSFPYQVEQISPTLNPMRRKDFLFLFVGLADLILFSGPARRPHRFLLLTVERRKQGGRYLDKEEEEEESVL